MEGYIKTAANVRRADRAATALGAYLMAGGEGYSWPEDPATAVKDMMIDLQHLCAQNDLWFDDLVDSARNHFDAESRNEDDEE